jgi:hypothetical protein
VSCFTCLAFGAEAFNFDDSMFDLKTGGFGGAPDRTFLWSGVRFSDGVAVPANEEGWCMRVFRVSAGDKRVQLFNSVCKPMRNEELQRAIRNRWLGAKPFVAQYIENFICSPCAMIRKQNFQNASADGRKLQPR